MKYPEEILRERIKVLEGALAFYADQENWKPSPFTFGTIPAADDRGSKACKALKKERQ